MGVRSELLKQRTTRTTGLLFLWMACLVALIVLLHVSSLKAENLSPRDGQLKVIGWGTSIGALFSSILGAMSITAEFRHGTIRPTLLATPRRVRVVVAKLLASILAGLVVGLLAEGLAAALEAAGLAVRGIHIALTGGDLAQLLTGGALAAGLFAAIGVGIGAAVRNQVAVIIGLCIWVLVIETTLIGNIPSAGKFAPGAAAGAIAGAVQTQAPSELVAPALGAMLLTIYAVAAAGLGARTTTRRDIN
jgi:ABC-type transport system involved in multi-copper enzyme maturation permease subunit